LGLRPARAFAEQIEIPTEILDRGDRNRIDAVLDWGDTGDRELGDPMRQRPDEITELLHGQGTVDPAVPLRQLRVVVLSAQYDLERPSTAHETREVLYATGAGAHTRRRLWLTENRRLACGKSHVTRQHELVAGTAGAPLDLRDADEPVQADVAEKKADRRFADKLRRLLPVLFDPGHVDVGNEIVGVCTLEHGYLDGAVGLGLLN
jgi:hypothetical protein